MIYENKIHAVTEINVYNCYIIVMFIFIQIKLFCWYKLSIFGFEAYFFRSRKKASYIDICNVLSIMILCTYLALAYLFNH